MLLDEDDLKKAKIKDILAMLLPFKSRFIAISESRAGVLSSL